MRFVSNRCKDLFKQKNILGLWAPNLLFFSVMTVKDEKCQLLLKRDFVNLWGKAMSPLARQRGRSFCLMYDFGLSHQIICECMVPNKLWLAQKVILSCYIRKIISSTVITGTVALN